MPGARFQYQGLAFVPLVVSTLTPLPDVPSWQPDRTPRLPVAAVSCLAQPTFVPAPPNVADYVVTPPQPSRVLPRCPDYKAYFAPVMQPLPEGIADFVATPFQPSRILPRCASYQAHFAPTFVPAPPNVADYVVTPFQPSRILPRCADYKAHFAPDRQPEPPKLSWHPTYPDRLVRPFLHPAYMPFYSGLIIPQAQPSAKLVAVWNDRGLSAQFRTTQNVGAGGGVTTLTDSFAGVAGTDLVDHLLDTGQSWFYNADNGLGRPRNQLNGSGKLILTDLFNSYGNPITQISPLIVATPCTALDQVVEVDFTYLDGIQQQVALVARCNKALPQGSSGVTAECATAGFLGGGGGIGWFIRGSLAGTTNTFAVALVDGQTYHLKLQVTLTQVKFYVDGVLIGTGTDYPTSAAGFVGFEMGAGAGASSINTPKLDNFTATIGGSQVFTDTFTGTAGTLLQNHVMDSGDRWQYCYMNHYLNGSGFVTSDGENVFGEGVLVSQPGTDACQIVELDLIPDMVNNPAQPFFVELHARSNNSDGYPPDSIDDHMALLLVSSGSFQTELDIVGEWLTGSYIQYFTTSMVDGQTYHIKLEITDTLVRGYLDGVLVVTALDYPVTPGGYVGFRLAVFGSNTTKVKNFSATLGCGQSMPQLVAVWNDTGLSAQVQTTTGPESIAGAHPIPPGPPPPPPPPVLGVLEGSVVTPFGSVF